MLRCAGMLRKYNYRRTLPHYQKDNRAIFATFAAHHRWHLPEAAREIVVEACLHTNGTKCTMHGLVVMPDHVHLVFTPLADNDGPISLPRDLPENEERIFTPNQQPASAKRPSLAGRIV